MEKLGVAIDEDKTKTAAATKPETCPNCGSKLVPNRNVPCCPKCGTEPFEAKK